MIILNLLPPQKKAQLVSEKNFSRVRAVIVLLLSVCAVAIALTFTSRYLVQSEGRKIQNQIDALKISLQTNGSALTDDFVKRINQKANVLFSIQKNYIKWSVVISSISEAVGQNITLESIRALPENSAITINGTAKTRTDLIDFQNNLKNIPFLENLDYPTAYLTIKENIPFQFTGTINREKVPGYDITRQ